MIDPSTEFGMRVQQRLTDEVIGWLTTVTSGGQPQSVPIWFLWQEDETLLMYSQSNAPKLRNISSNPKVSFHFDSDGYGDNIVRLEGKAEIASDIPPATDVPAYLEKYRERLPHIDMTPEDFAEAYATPIRMKIEAVRGF
jgi:PPOX class probable F420-dependent enzyme